MASYLPSEVEAKRAIGATPRFLAPHADEIH